MLRVLLRKVSSSCPDVEFRAKSGTLSIQLCREKALNALTQPMLLAIEQALQSSPRLVFLTGRGKAFCAGGDVKSLLTDEGLGQPSDQDIRVRFFRTEYTVDAALSKGHGYRLVSLLKGITMGGGYGLTSQNDLRIATGESIFAMPENKLGLFPDVGAVRSLVHCPDNFGKYLALTGSIINSRQMVQYGIADVLLENKAEVEQLEKGMVEADAQVLNRLGIWAKKAQPRSFEPTHPLIKGVFGLSKLSQIFKELEGSKDDFAVKTAAALRQLCPFSLCVTNRIYERAKTMSFKARLIEDFRLAVTCTHRKDFNAGVKAVLVDKGKVAAQWQHARVEDVAHDQVEAAFRPFKDRSIPVTELQLDIPVDYY